MNPLVRAINFRRCEGCGWRMHDYEIEYLICEKYPTTEKELSCRSERGHRNGLREEYKKRLIEQEANSKREHEDQQEI